MDEDSIRQPTAEAALFAGEAWFDPIEAGLRERIRGFLEELVEQELEAALGRGRYERGGTAGHRHGRRERRPIGSFGPVAIAVPRARLRAEDGTSRDGQKVLLAARSMGGESEAAWRAVLDDLVARGLRTPEFLILDGAAGLERALAALWPAVPAQRCTVYTTSTGICWPTRRRRCTRSFRPTTPT